MLVWEGLRHVCEFSSLIVQHFKMTLSPEVRADLEAEMLSGP